MGCNVQNIVSWYQKKIGTYDKQQWEKTVEQCILNGLTHVPMKSAKLKTELIDVDLVRGSAFTKAKPKHGFLTVTRLAALRLFFMPFYYQWWICQTSGRIFVALIILYSLQLFNTFLYFCNIWWYTVDASYNVLENIPPSEVLLPFAMMLVLSVIHSQIVSTHSTNGRHKKEELRSNAHVKRTKRMKRRNAFALKTRQSTDPKGHANGNCGNSYSLNELSKRSRIKIGISEETSRKHRTVAWDTIPVKSKSNYCTHLKCEDSGISSFGNASPCFSESLNVVAHCGEESHSPTLDDDGFESFDGNGSCDSNREEQDVSLTAEEYETSMKSNPTIHNVFAEKSLVTSNCCLKFKKHTDINSLNASCCDHNEDDLDSLHRANIPGKQSGNEDCVQIIVQCDANEENSVETTNTCGTDVKLNESCHQVVGPNKGKKDTDIDGSESEPISEVSILTEKRLITRRRGSQQNLTVSVKNLAESSFNSSGDESEDGGTLSSPGSCCPFTEGTTSAGEWVGVTTNSEECSYSSELDGSDNQFAMTNDMNEHPFAWEMEMVPNVILSSCAPVGKVSCTMWEKKDAKKANLSVLDISSAIIARVEAMPENVDYFYIGVIMSMALATIPCICRLTDSLYDGSIKFGSSYFGSSSASNTFLQPYCPSRASSSFFSYIVTLFQIAFGLTLRENIIVTIAIFERFCLAAIFFFLLTVAERTFKQRFLYAKFFSHLTSFRRARKSELPHFRLNKVRNIKSWLSVRSYLKKRGPQRSVDVIVSAAFLMTVILLSFLSFELLKDSEYNVEAVGWSVVIGFYMLRFITLGTKINKKYRNLSTLITEQINLYLQIEQKPNKKEEFMVANSVLKLAADLLKELERPFKISGFSANPYLYTVTKVVMLSALSGILSELLGFKLKLHKIKIK